MQNECKHISDFLFGWGEGGGVCGWEDGVWEMEAGGWMEVRGAAERRRGDLKNPETSKIDWPGSTTCNSEAFLFMGSGGGSDQTRRLKLRVRSKPPYVCVDGDGRRLRPDSAAKAASPI